jgi:hypothetical protein
MLSCPGPGWIGTKNLDAAVLLPAVLKGSTLKAKPSGQGSALLNCVEVTEHTQLNERRERYLPSTWAKAVAQNIREGELCMRSGCPEIVESHVYDDASYR